MGLAKLLSLKKFLAAGLMSGTSMDGVDAALVELQAAGDAPDPKLLAFTTVPYPEEQRDALFDLALGQQCTAEDIATLNTSVAVAFAGGFFAACREADVDPAEVHFIGSHGQTVAHVPPGTDGKPIAGTLQLGSPGMIAALTGVTTVGDFRVADIALGGQGAPLVPYVDYLVRRSGASSRAILNIGGIANVTYLPRKGRREDTLAFDTGPGNMLIDAVYRALYPGQGRYDSAGEKAANGSASEELIEPFLKRPFFSKQPPKSAGHSEFGMTFAWEFLDKAKQLDLLRADIMASAAMITALSVGSAIQRFVAVRGPIDEMLISGGGVKNATLVRMIRDAVAPVPVRAIDVLGIPDDAKEAVDFAVLARETILGRTNVIASATGVSKETVLGTIAPGSNL
ncbi:MAG: anhydro-N-acetylmuramic acid kinase [Chitinivibrionia bacterium]|nr:anhydro-N-acetylmuramic acid kinase [Chitinivibrionia bacterium]